MHGSRPSLGVAEPLSPTSFLDRSSAAFAERIAVIDGDRTFTYARFAERCGQLARALRARNIETGDRVAALCSNSHLMLELHHAVPQLSAVLVPLNVRLSSGELEYILDHSGAAVLFASREFAEQALTLRTRRGIDVIVEGDDGYESFLASAPVAGAELPVANEWDLLAINYTSGTTGRPKGVMYHHRGAFLQSVAMAYHARLTVGSTYLWTLPMFHCNGWCFTWAVTAAGGTHLCLRSVQAGQIWSCLREQPVTHFSAAPTVLTMIAHDPAAGPLGRAVHVDTGGAPPSPSLLARLEPWGLQITHLYGLTETFGPVSVNEWWPEWDELDPSAAAGLRARQGIGNIVARPLRVLDQAGDDVPADGRTVGEIAVRGNVVMLGYYKDDDETRRALRNGCFLTGDLGVMHADGYVEIRDRGKDVIISGGENIASVEVEQVLDAHPDVVESAVVSAPDEKWGEIPVAFVTPRSGSEVSAELLADHVRGRLAGFKVPRAFTFGPLPKTATGKIQKNVLRARVREEAGPQVEPGDAMRPS